MTELLKKYLSSVRVFDANNDQGNDPPKKPEIKVESVDNRNLKDGNLDPNHQEENDEDEDEEDKEEEEEEENKDDDNQETDEEKKVRLAKEKEDRRQGRIQKRIDKLTALNANKDNEIAELKKQLAEKPVEGLTEEEVERRAAKKAEELATAKELDRKQKEFEKTANNLIKAATKIDKDFEKKINDVAKETDVLMPQYMLDILADLEHENGHEILAQLANDEDLYEEICGLSERRMTRRLDKISEELKAKGGKKKPVERERLPDPIEPINNGTNNRGNTLPKNPTSNMDEYVRIRTNQVAQARKQGRNIY